MYRIETFNAKRQLLPYDTRVFDTQEEVLAHGKVVQNLSERTPIIRNMKVDRYISPSGWKTIEEHFGKQISRVWPARDPDEGRQTAKFRRKYIDE